MAIKGSVKRKCGELDNPLCPPGDHPNHPQSQTQAPQAKCAASSRELPLAVWFHVHHESDPQATATTRPTTTLELSPACEQKELNDHLQAALYNARGFQHDGPALHRHIEDELKTRLDGLDGRYCVPCSANLARQLPLKLRGCGDRDDIKYLLLGTDCKNKQAGATLMRIMQSIAAVISRPRKPTAFKIGITYTPLLRWQEYKRQRREKIWQMFHVLDVSMSRGWTLMLEAALISHYRDGRGCYNMQPGGEGLGQDGDPPFFTYMVSGDANPRI
jgi:hypothetical protein